MIKIEGGQQLQKTVQEAIELLRKRLPEEYRFAERQIKTVKDTAEGDAHIVLSIGTLCVNGVADVRWLASVMVREAHIRALYYKLGEERTMPCKMFALFKQEEVLKKLRATKLAAYAHSLYGKSEFTDPAQE